MVTTNIVKYQNDGDDELTAYCDDDDTADEIGPAKWDDVNNRLEINCNGVDAIVRWDDGGNNLESRTTDDGCCEEAECEACGVNGPTSDANKCFHAEDLPKYMLMTCAGFAGDCAVINGTHVLECHYDATYYEWQLTDGTKVYKFQTNNVQTRVEIWVGATECISKTDVDMECSCSGSIKDGAVSVSWEPCTASGSTPCPCDLSGAVEGGGGCCMYPEDHPLFGFMPKFLSVTAEDIFNCGGIACCDDPSHCCGCGYDSCGWWNGRTVIVEYVETCTWVYRLDYSCDGPPENCAMQAGVVLGGFGLHVGLGDRNCFRSVPDVEEWETCDDLPITVNNINDCEEFLDCGESGSITIDIA